MFLLCSVRLVTWFMQTHFVHSLMVLKWESALVTASENQNCHKTASPNNCKNLHLNFAWKLVVWSFLYFLYIPSVYVILELKHLLLDLVYWNSMLFPAHCSHVRLGILKQYAVSCTLFPADCWEVPGKAVSSWQLREGGCGWVLTTNDYLFIISEWPSFKDAEFVWLQSVNSAWLNQAYLPWHLFPPTCLLFSFTC